MEVYDRPKSKKRKILTAKGRQAKKPGKNHKRKKNKT